MDNYKKIWSAAYSETQKKVRKTKDKERALEAIVKFREETEVMLKSSIGMGNLIEAYGLEEQFHEKHRSLDKRTKVLSEMLKLKKNVMEESISSYTFHLSHLATIEIEAGELKEAGEHIQVALLLSGICGNVSPFLVDALAALKESTKGEISFVQPLC